MKKTLAILAVAGLASVASAQSAPKVYSTNPEPNLAIPDNNPQGVSSTIIVPDTGIIADFEYLWIDMTHSWVGDLTITLSHTGGSAIVLDRPGFPASTFGNSDDLAGIYTFTDVDPAFPETAGSGLVAPGFYRSATDLGLAFNGDEKFGDWTLTIVDAAAGDTGTLNAWGFAVTNVPTPGAFALLGLGGLAAARRRRA